MKRASPAGTDPTGTHEPGTQLENAQAQSARPRRAELGGAEEPGVGTGTTAATEGPDTPAPPDPEPPADPVPGGPNELTALTPQKARARRWILGLSTATFLAAGAAGVTITISGNGGGDKTGNPHPNSPAAAVHTITLPAAADGFFIIKSPLADRYTAQLRNEIAASPGTLAREAPAMKTGMYAGQGFSGPAVMFIGLSAKDAPAFNRHMKQTKPSVVTDQMLQAAGALQTTRFPAGQLGGVLRCGHGTQKRGIAVSACAWADHSTIGAVVASPATTDQMIAGVALAFRTAAER